MTDEHQHAHALLPDTDLERHGWWYMSFTDPDRPEGRRFIGGLYIDGHGIEDALARSHDLGLNPGGEVAFVALPTEEFETNVPESHRRRLLTREEIG